MTANPFGLSHFYNDKNKNGSMTLPKGQQSSFQYRIFCHCGDVRGAAVAERYLDYINPPKVTALA